MEGAQRVRTVGRMTSMTHAPTSQRRSGAAVTPSRGSVTPLPQESREVDPAAKDARETRLLLTIVGAGALVVLVFFLTMMWILSSYGPTVQ
jgi:hypothetical protein